MISVTGVELSDERNLIKDFSEFVLSRFVDQEVLDNSNIKIKLMHIEELPLYEQEEFKQYEAWMFYDGRVKRKEEFRVILNKGAINNRATVNKIYRYRNVLKYLAHELVHVKQYLNNEMIDLVGDKTKFKGKIYPTNSDAFSWDYWESPWELEAYARSEGLYSMYMKERDL